jgi:diamine N-acetyltransferase
LEASGRRVRRVSCRVQLDAVDPADESYWIGGLLIDAASQGRGLGRATVQLMVSQAREAARPSVALSHEPDNTVTRQLYAALGFVETGETEDDEVVARVNIGASQPAD